jgi:hypothetical protein
LLCLLLLFNFCVSRKAPSNKMYYYHYYY